MSSAYKKEVIQREGLKVVYSLSEMKMILNGHLVFTENENKEINITKCSDSIIESDMPMKFEAYFPDEKIILTIGEGFNYYPFSVGECKFVRRFPYLIKHSPNRKSRINSDVLDPAGDPKYFIEFFDDEAGRYKKAIDIGIFFGSNLMSGIDDIEWLNDSELIFSRHGINEKKSYFIILIKDLPFDQRALVFH